MPSSIRLAPGEEIVCEAQVSYVAYVSALLLLVVLMMTGGLSGLITTELTVTNKRVVGRRGFIRRTNINITHVEISGANVRRGLLGAMFDYGTLTILTKAGERYVFKGITMPFYVAQQIEEAVEVATLGYKLSDFAGEERF